MIVGIIGSGKVGSALGAWAAKVDCEVLFDSRGSASASKTAKKAGDHAKSVSLAELCEKSELILLTLPYAEVGKTLSGVSNLLTGKTVVDVTNPITPNKDHRELTIGLSDSGAETIARQNPNAHVVKAFNAVFAEVYQSQNSSRGGQKISIFYCGDNELAKGKVRGLISRFGFDPIDAGPLANARFLEPLSLLNIRLGRELGFGTSIGFSLARD